jgi:hypothetical protein
MDQKLQDISLRFIELGEQPREEYKVAAFQVRVPVVYFDEKLRLREDVEVKHGKHVEDHVRRAINEGADVICLPELSTSMNIEQKLQQISLQYPDRIIIGGSYYDNNSRNRCPIFINQGLYVQEKLFPAQNEREGMQQGNSLNVFINSRIGDFAILICYDFTYSDIIQRLKHLIDILFVIASNRDNKTFRKAFNDYCYQNYWYITYVNNDIYGGSAFYLPVKYDDFEQDKKGVDSEGIIYKTLRLKELDDSRAGKQSELLKSPLAGVRPRHLPYVSSVSRTVAHFYALVNCANDNDRMRLQYFTELRAIWEEKTTSFEEKILKSCELYKLYKNYPFAQDNEARLVFLWQKHISIYDRSFNQDYRIVLRILNISDKKVISDSFWAESTEVPLSNKAFLSDLKCYDGRRHKGSALEVKLLRSSLEYKEVEYTFSPMSTGDIRSFEINYNWPADSLERESARYHFVLIDCFTVLLDINVILPKISLKSYKAFEDGKSYKGYYRREPWQILGCNVLSLHIPLPKMGSRYQVHFTV